MEPIVFLLAFYIPVLLYLLHFGTDVFETAWNLNHRVLIRNLLLFFGVFCLLLVIGFLVLNVNRKLAGGDSILFLNIFCGAIVLAILLGIFAGRYVFAGIISILYVFDLVQFHQFLAAVTGDSSKDSGIGYGYLFTLFINLAGFAAAVFIDHIVQLVQRRTKA